MPGYPATQVLLSIVFLGLATKASSEAQGQIFGWGAGEVETGVGRESFCTPTFPFPFRIPPGPDYLPRGLQGYHQGGV